MHTTRRERDAIGEVQVPSDAYYGAFTARALANFQLSGMRAKPVFIRALALTKKAAAQANAELGMLDAKSAAAICKAADEVLAGKLDSEFPLDAFQAGAGTPFNMNMNEVLANRANELLGGPLSASGGKGPLPLSPSGERGTIPQRRNECSAKQKVGRKGEYKPVHPNDHVNLGQSSNDVIPTVVRLSVMLNARGLVKEGRELEAALQKKAREFGDVKKLGRTHLQDAVPTTLGNEFNAYASALRRDVDELECALDRLGELGIGGTALGTGINAHPQFKEKIVLYLSKLTQLKLRSSKETVELAQNMNAFLQFSGALRMLAVTLARAANDLKLLSSGPRGGLGELILPEVEPGSSIMPGKVNPSIPEAVEMCAYHVMGSDRAVELACKSGQLDLNTNTPLIAHELLGSVELMENCCRMFREKCVVGIRADRKRIAEIYIKSNTYVTALTPRLGYAKVAELVKESLRTGKGVKELVLEKGLMSEKEIEKILMEIA
ncbi:MAG: lyase family protein [Candidatus Burarchaeum sp.]|nr:lyase family protein [Candidatus Burarchaeum sp.]MDO8339914.1 lyase family protein [Candidatus Burarchaeum sp.]